MAGKSLEARVAAIEKQLAGKALQDHFREQAELIDRLLTYRFEEFDKKGNAKLEQQFESKLAPVRNDLAAIKYAVTLISYALVLKATLTQIKLAVVEV
jgi:hypothetical protein